ncbi:glycosyl hydrolase family 18 protein [Paenibacillus sp. RC67]|uniref:glycosyl hydrolase family 18 protein n=1 Tax=Paenibacillus sp. RC67 TaxID=3039392 RepID=UPI0024AE720F|nr:glycosyl hydrolase family 18 protein [Paenibacillus sp. RC67]
MKKSKLSFYTVWFLFLCLLTASASPASAVTTVQGQYLDNAAFFSHNYVKYTSFVNLVPTLADKMDHTYKVNYWFPNSGFFTANGLISNASTELAQVKSYLNAVKSYEDTNGTKFKILAWLSADSATVDVTNAAVRAAIVNECKKLTDTSVPGSYVSGANRAFDGVILDLEPSGNNDTRYNAYKQLMIEIKQGIGSSKLTGVAAHKWGNGSNWSWSPTYFYYMGRNVDVVVAMTYDSGAASGSGYQSWMQQQTTDIMHAISGKTWNNNADHPAPMNGVRVFIGQPAFADKPASGHNSQYENMEFGLQGVDTAITALQNDSADPSANYFHGMAVYLHSDGSGADGFASWTTDWWKFGHYWLGSW